MSHNPLDFWAKVIPVDGKYPPPRANGGGVYCEDFDSLVVVYGGVDDVWAFNYTAGVWSPVEEVGGRGDDLNAPPRDGFTLNRLSNDKGDCEFLLVGGNQQPDDPYLGAWHGALGLVEDNTFNLTWRRLNTTSCVSHETDTAVDCPRAVTDHVATLSGTTLLVTTGRDLVTSEELNSTHALDLATNSWTVDVNAADYTPRKREKADGIVVRGEWTVYGGRWNNHRDEFDIPNMSWRDSGKSYASDSTAYARFGSKLSAVPDKDLIIMFGGFRKSRYLDNPYHLDNFNTVQVTRLDFVAGPRFCSNMQRYGGVMAWCDSDFTEGGPRGRHDHIQHVRYKDGKYELVVYGGHAVVDLDLAVSEPFGDMWTFDIDKALADLPFHGYGDDVKNPNVRRILLSIFMPLLALLVCCCCYSWHKADSPPRKTVDGEVSVNDSQECDEQQERDSLSKEDL